ncbi:hypothetical protein vseg_018043 [Gypsophila vaccaria]
MPEVTQTNRGESSQQYSNPYDDPLYLSAYDSPGMQFVNTVFNGRNYLQWSRGVLMALGLKNKEGFLTGKTMMPDITSPKLIQWRRCDNMVRCWVLNTLSADIKEGFMTSKSAKLLWSDIFERYGQSNGPLLYQLKKELCNIEQDNSSVAEYFNKLKRHWDDIEELECIPECSCGVMDNCTCQILKKMLEIASKEKVMVFMMGLNDTYDTLRTNILSMDPIPTINKAYSIVQHVESQKHITSVITSSQDVSALSVDKSYNSVGGWKRDHKKAKLDDRWCGYCKKSGHTKDTCFRLHPEQKLSYQNRYSNQKFGAQRMYQYTAHNAVTAEDVPFGCHGDTPASSKGGCVSHEMSKFDPEVVTAVYQQMMNMIQGDRVNVPVDYNSASVNFAGKVIASNATMLNNNCGKFDWIIDSGATDHMTANKSLLSKLRVLNKPVLVGLPDGSTKIATHIGEIQIHTKVVLQDVLLVPEFKHNLLSVGKLLSTNAVLIHFDMHQCLIQDQAKNTLLYGHKEGGLVGIIL